MATARYSSGRVKLDLPPAKVLNASQRIELFESVAEYLDELGINRQGGFHISLEVEYLESEGDLHS
mgnify:CR=1 FL=1